MDVNVNEGDTVTVDQLLCILDAMKMENEIYSPFSGAVTRVHVKKGDSVDTGTLLFTIE